MIKIFYNTNLDLIENKVNEFIKNMKLSNYDINFNVYKSDNEPIYIIIVNYSTN